MTTNTIEINVPELTY